MSELATNAVRHTDTHRIGICLTRAASGTVRLAVNDTSRNVPVIPGEVSNDGISGRGLFLVDALATRWGYTLLVTGKRLWAELDIPDEEKPIL